MLILKLPSRCGSACVLQTAVFVLPGLRSQARCRAGACRLLLTGTDTLQHALQGDPRWRLADPLCTFLFAGLVLITTFGIVRDISDILMERVPRAHDIEQINSALLAVRS